MNDSKYPRAWLRERHAYVAAELDACRRRALPDAAMTWRGVLHELVHPNRFAWSTLAMVWIGLGVLRVFESPPHPTHAENPPPPAVLAAWIHQLKSNEAFAQLDRHP